MRTLFACLVAVSFAAPSWADDAPKASAKEPIKLKLEDFKFELAEGVPSELFGLNEGDSKLFFYAPGSVVATFKVAEAGEYTVTVSASCDEAEGVKAKMRLQIGEKDAKAEKEKEKDKKKDGDKPAAEGDKKPDAPADKPAAATEKPASDDKKPDGDKKGVKKFAIDKEVTLTETTEQEYTVTVKLKAGENKVVIAFTNDVYKENEFDRNLYIHSVKLEAVKPKAKTEKNKESGK